MMTHRPSSLQAALRVATCEKLLTYRRKLLITGSENEVHTSSSIALVVPKARATYLLQRLCRWGVAVNSSGYSPSSHTFPALSCAKKAISDSPSLPAV